MKTLLVDDDAISIFLTEKLFQYEGLGQDLRAFQSPEQALQHVQQAAEQQQLPDVMLLDLNMPVLNGWDVLAALQPYETQFAGRCFIYILTSSLSPTDQARARGLPLVTDCLRKPLTGPQIQAIRAHVLEQQRY